MCCLTTFEIVNSAYNDFFITAVVCTVVNLQLNTEVEDNPSHNLKLEIHFHLDNGIILPKLDTQKREA